MAQGYLELLQAFNFTEMQAWIAVISFIMFMGNLLGGILSALTFINSKQLQPRPLSERISFRLFILSEVILLIFIFFYHVFMIEEMILAHIVYWVSATMMMPLLAIIGSQVMLVTFSSKVHAKEAELKRRQKAMRDKRRQEMDEGPASAGSSADRVMAKRRGKPA